MSAEYRVMGLFTDENQVVSAIRDIKDSPWTMHRVHSPIPSHKIDNALGSKKSKVGYFTLVGGITGFFAGFLLAAFTASQWNLIVSGKPVISLVPFFIVGFEFTILLFSVMSSGSSIRCSCLDSRGSNTMTRAVQASTLGSRRPVKPAIWKSSRHSFKPKAVR